MFKKVSDDYYYKTATRAASVGSVFAILSIISSAIVANDLRVSLIIISIFGWISGAVAVMFVLLVPVGLYNATRAALNRIVLTKQQRLRLTIAIIALLLQAILISGSIYQLLIL